MIAGASVFMVLAIVGLIGTHSPWYLGGLMYTAGVCGWRLWQTRVYARSRDSGTPTIWAWRSIRSGWATAAGWGAWSAVVLCEPEKSIVIMTIGMHAGLVAGGAIRNCAVPTLAVGQTFLSTIPLFLACVACNDVYLHVYAGIIALHIVAVLTLTKHLHFQTLKLLLKEKEASDLVSRLEIANQDLGVTNRHLETLVGIDALTGVSNRWAFDLASSREWRRCIREQTPLSMLLLDVDHFKAFNDFYGHQAGDFCLREVAIAINSALRRPGDILARYGGEEFMVTLSGSDLEEAIRVAKDIVDAIASRALVHDASAFHRVTVSIGAACLFADQHTTVASLISLADTALYSAKREGRNCVRAAEPHKLALHQIL